MADLAVPFGALWGQEGLRAALSRIAAPPQHPHPGLGPRVPADIPVAMACLKGAGHGC